MKDLLSLIGQMTLEEKVGQLIQLNSAFFGADSELTGPAKERGLSREAL